MGSLFEVKDGTFYCSVYAPVHESADMFAPGHLYAYADGPTADDAVMAARAGLWKGL